MKARELLEQLEACHAAINWVGNKTIKEAWATCPRGDWMLWFYQKQYPKNIRELTLAKGHCANTVRHLMRDTRSLSAVDAAIAYGEGKINREELDAAAYAAADAAYAADAAAYAAADADAATAAYAANAAADAAAAGAAYNKNQRQAADICRRYLSIGEKK